MKALTAFASAAAVAVALSAASAPAHAAVFAEFTPDSSAMDVKWIKTTKNAHNGGDGGHLFSIAPNTQNATSAVNDTATHFKYLDPALSSLGFIPATFHLDATVTQTHVPPPGPATTGHPATQNGAGVWTQTDVNGGFSFIYAGPTVANYNNSGRTLHQNENLLSGVFTDAFIQGAGGSGSFNLAVLNGGHASYTSSLEKFIGLAPNSEEFAFNFLAVINSLSTKAHPLPGFNASAGQALDSFRANGGGNFSFQTVPEPATWGLMIMGFGGMGMVLRNRRRTAVARA